MKSAAFRLLIGCVLLAFNAWAFEAKMTIQPPVIQLGEAAVLTIEIRNAKKVPAPTLPDVPGLQFVGAGQTQHSSWVNGTSDRYTAFNFQVYPQKTGEFTIGPFTYQTDGQAQSLQGSLTVVVTPGEAAQPQSWNEIVFARLQVDRESTYVQAPFGLQLSIYSRQGVQLAGNINLQNMPETGFDGIQWQEIPGNREVINNVIFDVRRFQAVTRAVSSGTFEFSPVATVQVVIPNQNRQRNSPFDDAFFGSMFQQNNVRPVDLPVEKAVLTVKPIPEADRPAGFNGAIGRFNFSVTAQPLNVRPGDPITLTMTVSGDGNFDRVIPPPAPDNDQFRRFGDPVRKQAEQAVVFEQVISPRHAAVHEIPAIPFVFFDTPSGTYRTITSQPIPIVVTATSNDSAQVFAKDTVLLPPPETPFVTESELQKITNALKTLWQHVRPWRWTPLIALALGAVVFFGRKIHLVRRQDTARIRRQKAPHEARKALRAASQACRTRNTKAFFDALWDALSDYFGHRLNLPPGSLNTSTVVSAMERAGLDAPSSATLRSIFEQVEARRYGLPGDISAEEMTRLQLELEQMLKRCEKIKQ